MTIEVKINKAVADHTKIRDAEKNCIFCDQAPDRTMVNGHYEKRSKAFSRVELYLANSNQMHFRCNQMDEKEDYLQQVNFRANMTRRYGESLVEEIEKEGLRVVKNSIWDKKEILKEIKQLTKKL